MSNPGRWMAHCHIAEHLEHRTLGLQTPELGPPRIPTGPIRF
jgi:hypothetical protein